MLKLAKFAVSSPSQSAAPFFNAVRSLAGWNKDWKPGPYPKTEEERLAAAKKYGIHPKEYEPYPDDGTGYGDYPKLPDIAVETKSPWFPYTDPAMKRNYTELIHPDHDMYSEDRWGPTPTRFTVRYMVTTFLCVMTGCFALYYYLEDKKMFLPTKPKQYPQPGVVNYTFDPK